jgi:hypothetical protein
MTILGYFGLRGVLANPSVASPRIPSIVFCIYQLMFAAITCVVTFYSKGRSFDDICRPMIAIGAVAERGRLGPMIVFVFVWATAVYDPIANWTWNPNGWSYVLGGLDFAGGTPVHISSGTAALAISLYLGKRRGYGTDRLAYKPNNTSYVILGTIFLWFGWFGFNGGSALSANLRAANACIITNLAASVAGLTWMFWVSPQILCNRVATQGRRRTGVLRENGPQSASVLERSLDWSRSHQVLVSSEPVSSFHHIISISVSTLHLSGVGRIWCGGGHLLQLRDPTQIYLPDRRCA